MSDTVTRLARHKQLAPRGRWRHCYGLVGDMVMSKRQDATLASAIHLAIARLLGQVSRWHRVMHSTVMACSPLGRFF